MVVFGKHRHGSAMSTHVSLHPESPSHLPAHPIPLSCPRALALSALLHGSNLHWYSDKFLIRFCCCCCWVVWVLYIFCKYIYDLQKSSSICQVVFYFSWFPLLCRIFLVWCSPIFTFAFVFFAWGHISRKILLRPMLQNILPMISSSSFMVSLNHFELICCMV